MQDNGLPSNWRDTDPAPAKLAKIGTDWCKEGRELILAVPSIIIPTEWNYLINPSHSEFTDLDGYSLESFSIDPRLGLSL